MTTTTATRRQISVSLRTKMLVFFTLLFSVVFALSFYWFWSFTTQIAEDNLRRELTAIAETVAEEIDAGAHAALYASDAAAGRPLDDARYLDLVQTLTEAKELSGQVLGPDGQETFRVLLYTYVPTSEPGTVSFVGSSSALNNPPGGAEFRENYQPQSAAMLNGLQATTVNLDVPITDQWGRWVSAFTPIRDGGEIVGAVGVDMRDTTVAALQQRIRNAMLPAFLLTYAVLFGAVWLLSHRISRPVVGLTHSADRVAAGHYDLDFGAGRFQRFPDETSTLAAVFEQMVDKVASRERKLKEQVQQLKIRIDRAKEDQQVAEITETDFFQSLEAKAARLRQSRGR